VASREYPNGVARDGASQRHRSASRKVGVPPGPVAFIRCEVCQRDVPPDQGEPIPQFAAGHERETPTPIQNVGTLLENAVVVEAALAILEVPEAARGPLEFASAFAMPTSICIMRLLD
jgi:hypothetical protein